MYVRAKTCACEEVRFIQYKLPEHKIHTGLKQPTPLLEDDRQPRERPSRRRSGSASCAQPRRRRLGVAQRLLRCKRRVRRVGPRRHVVVRERGVVGMRQRRRGRRGEARVAIVHYAEAGLQEGRGTRRVRSAGERHWGDGDWGFGM